MNGRSRRSRLLAIASILGLLCALALVAAPAGAAATARHASTPISISAKNAPSIGYPLGFILNWTGLCLGISGGADDAPAVQWYCLNGHPDQQWSTGAGNSGGFYQLINNDGQCLGVAGGSTAQGAQVVGWKCLGTSHPDQYWFIDHAVPMCGPYYPIANYKSGRYLGVAGGSTLAGAKVVIWNYQATCNNQFWLPGG
jgi:Ricin-type beta-trefoil lectin domain-like